MLQVAVRRTDGVRRGLDGVRGRELVDVVWRRGLIICGLSGLAVTQPVLDLFGNNAEFFVAGSYSTSQIVAFALFVASVLPLIGIGLTTLGYLVDRRVGTVVFAAVVALLAAAFGLALLRTVGVDAIGARRDRRRRPRRDHGRPRVCVRSRAGCSCRT